MRKYLAIFGVIILGLAVLGLAVYVGYQDARYTREVAQKHTALDKGASTTKADEKNLGDEALDPVRHAPSWYGWYGFFRWPNGTTALAIFLTLFAIVEQTRQTRNAAEATQIAVCTADKSLTLQEDTAKRQLRAYVCMETANLGFPSKNRPVASIVFKNFGQTPAYEAQSWISIRIDSYPPSIPFVIQKPGHPSPKSTLGPGAATQFSAPLGRVLTDDEMTELGTAQLTIYVYGRFTYKDTFKQDRFTHWRLIAGGPEGVGMKGRTEKGEILWSLSPDIEGNESN